MNLNPKLRPNEFWTMARFMAEQAARAYNVSTVRNRQTDAAALIEVDSQGNIIISFQGSSSALDFLEDAEFYRTEFIWPASSDEPAEVHHGFMTSFESLLRWCSGSTSRRNIPSSIAPQMQK